MIELHAIRKTYRRGGHEVRALDGIALRIARREFVAVMGASGSGKSTLLNVLGVLDKPDSGSYHLDGDEVSGFDDDAASTVRNQRIGFVFQSFHLLPRLTVLENVLLPQRYAAAAGEDVVVARGDTPVARIVPIRKGQFKLGILKDELKGVVPDFLEPMDGESLDLW